MLKCDAVGAVEARDVKARAMPLAASQGAGAAVAVAAAEEDEDEDEVAGVVGATTVAATAEAGAEGAEVIRKSFRASRRVRR